MFTGIVQAVGKIEIFGKGVLIEFPSTFPEPQIGESISVDGICLTVAKKGNNSFIADISEETLKRTSLNQKAIAKGLVNLEPALQLSDRLGGHLVSGHIDGLGKVVSIESLPNSWWLKIAWDNCLFSKYTCEKASIALNGVSLTVASIEKGGEIFTIAVIPHTWFTTCLKNLKKGEKVNLEADLMAKYSESLLKKDFQNLDSQKSLKSNQTNISADWLKKNGF